MTQKNELLSQDFTAFARTALAGRAQDVQLLIHRASKKYRETYPEMAEALLALLKEAPSRSAPLRRQADVPLPVDLDSRLQLLRVESAPPEMDPILSEKNRIALGQVLSERKNSSALLRHGLHPTKSMLFTGPPGVGKTLTAKWIAHQLNRPLLVLDLAAVMSSFLGRTGNNIRFVLDYAKNLECVLLLDEFDAIAKRRDDTSEIGELKRLVTVLLQEIDDWPASGLLLAATNHPDLLDPAIWRRFELVIDFGPPDRNQAELLIKRLIQESMNQGEQWSKVLSYIFNDKSYSEVERRITNARKSSIINNRPFVESLEKLIEPNETLSKKEQVELAVALEESGIISQRRVGELTGVSRDTIRKHRADGSPPNRKSAKRAADPYSKRLDKQSKK